MQKAKIKLSSTNIEQLNQLVNQIKDISAKVGVVMKGPIPLPTRKLKVVTRKAPGGRGTETFERYEMRVHKRLIEIMADERVLHLIMRVQIPPDVNIEIQLVAA